MEVDPKLVEAARAALDSNDQGQWTSPAIALYPHQWLWDSCFIAIGLRHHNPQRAATELKSLFRGQWLNGMLPHIVINPAANHWADAAFWQSQRSPEAPAGVATSGLTQPPFPAIAALAVAQKLPPAEARVFLKGLYPKLVAYHNWIYQERDPDGTGLAVLIHPWETGLDNSPGWLKVLKTLSPLWATTFLSLHLGNLFRRFRRDTETVPTSQRNTDEEIVKLVALAFYARRRHYNSKKIIAHSRYTLTSLIFNCVLIAANRALSQIAGLIAEDLPAELQFHASQTVASLEKLWDPGTGQYYAAVYKTGKLLDASAVTTFLPLYAGTISKERAAQLVQLLKDTHKYWPAWPVPSVSLDSPGFDEDRYWQGPVWMNMNWLIIQGLRNYGYHQEADELKAKTLALVERSGFREYYSALTCSGYGGDHFSWTAALFLDLAAEHGNSSAVEPTVQNQTSQSQNQQPRAI